MKTEPTARRREENHSLATEGQFIRLPKVTTYKRPSTLSLAEGGRQEPQTNTSLVSMPQKRKKGETHKKKKKRVGSALAYTTLWAGIGGGWRPSRRSEAGRRTLSRNKKKSPGVKGDQKRSEQSEKKQKSVNPNHQKK